MDFLWLYMSCPLFQKMDQQLLLEASQCGWWQVRQQNSQQPLLQCGEPVRYIGVVLSGSVDIVFPDFWGNQTIVGRLGPGEEFAEAFFCAEVEKMPVNVVTADAGQVLLLDMNALKNDTQPIGQKFYAGLMESMVHILARKNTVLVSESSCFPAEEPEKNCLPIFRNRLCAVALPLLKSHLTASSWRIIWRWSAAPFRTAQPNAGGGHTAVPSQSFYIAA